MDKKELKVLLEKGENTQVKIKCNFYPETIKTLSAFANSSGGIVIIDRGKCLKSTNLSIITDQWRLEIDNKTKPPMTIEIYSEKIGDNAYIIFYVDGLEHIPIAFDGNYYFRKDDKNKKMNLNDLINYYQKWY